MVGVSRNKKIRNEIAFHDYLAKLSIMHVPSIICYKIGIYSIKYVVMLHIHNVLGSKIHPRELSYKPNQKVGETQFRIQLQLRIVCH